MATEITPAIMRVVGQIVAEVYGDDVPNNVMNTILRFPMRGIGLMMQRGDIKSNNPNLGRLMDKIPHDLENSDSMPFDCQGAFWIGYHQYCKLTDDVKNYSVKELAIIGEALYGTQWQSDLARDLKLSDARRVRAWLLGERKIPLGVWADIADLLKQRQTTISNLLNKMTCSEN